MNVNQTDRKIILEKLERFFLAKRENWWKKCLRWFKNKPSPTLELTKLEFEKIQYLLSTKVGLGFERIRDDVWEKHLDQRKHVFLQQHPDCKDFDTANAKTFGSLIQGDNLPALFLLQNIYQEQAEKVHFIYIDPPYNVGTSGFIYNNDYRLKGSDKKLLQVQQEDAFRHSKWLSFMEARLVYAKKLLRDDGLIAISIDDNELYHLKLLMDKIFGNDCYKGTIIWHKGPGMWITPKDGKTKSIRNDHEYVLIYERMSGRSAFKTFVRSHQEQAAKEKLMPLLIGGTKGIRSANNSLYYPILDPQTGKEVWPYDRQGKEKTWAISRETFQKVNAQGNIQWKATPTNPINPRMPYRKRKPASSDCLISIISSKTVPGSNAGMGQKDLTKDLKEKDGNFSYPKPVNFVKHLIKYMMPNKDGLVLDFFAGSGTTACAVAELNKEDGGNRTFVLITNTEGDDAKQLKNDPNYSIFTRFLYPRLSNNKRKYQIACKVFTIDEKILSLDPKNNATFASCQSYFLKTGFCLLSIAKPHSPSKNWSEKQLEKNDYVVEIGDKKYGFFQSNLDVNMRFDFQFKKKTDDF